MNAIKTDTLALTETLVLTPLRLCYFYPDLFVRFKHQSPAPSVVGVYNLASRFTYSRLSSSTNQIERIMKKLATTTTNWEINLEF